jgi:hypothetical protein
LSPSDARWCDGIPPVTTTVWCNERSHRITWRRGKVVLEDHHLGAEHALLALGGAVPECMRVLRRWQARTGWDVAPVGFRAPGLTPIPIELVTVRELTAVRAWERSWRRRPWSRDGELLARKLRKHALAPLLDSVRMAAEWFVPGIASIADLDVHLAEGDPAVHGWMDAGGATATAVLAPSWLYRVWARNLGLVDGHLIADVLGDPDESISVRVAAVRWDEAFEGAWSPAIHLASADPTIAGGWTLRWDDAAI